MAVEVPVVAFYLLTIAVVLVLVLAGISLYYLIRLLRAAERLTNTAHDEYRHLRSRLRHVTNAWGIWRLVRLFKR